MAETAGGIDFDVDDALTDLQHAASLLEQVQDAHDYEQGTAFAMKSIAHSVLHMARGSGVIDPMSLRVLAVKWERRELELAGSGNVNGAAVYRQCALELRALLGGDQS